MAGVKEVPDKRLVSVVARKISKMSPADWKGAAPAMKQPFRKTAVAVLRTISAYEERQVTKAAKPKPKPAG